MANGDDTLFVDPLLLQQAERLCKRRLQNDPDNRPVLRSLAEVYRKQGNLGKAAAVYDRLFHLDPQDQEAGYVRAVFCGKEWPTAPKGIRVSPFVLLRDFLPPEFHDALLPFVNSVQGKFIPVPMGDGQYDPNTRQTLEFPNEVAWEGRQRFRGHLAKILPSAIPRLHLPPFKIGPLEVQVRAYQDGHFFKVHRDADPNSRYAARAINFVYYFHKCPRPYAGGDLLLFDSDVEAEAGTFTRSRFTRVVPEDNSLILFPPNFYHCVIPIQCPSKDFSDSRFVINGHVRKRAEAKPADDGPVETVGVAGS